MDKLRKRKLLEQYKHRRPEMGIISFHCKVTNESFLGISKDTKTDFNSNRFKLSANFHPNKRLQTLWNQQGEDGFECSVMKVLEYEDPNADHTAKLETLLEQCLAHDPQAMKIWK